MKKIIFFAAVAIALSFASCNCNNKSASTEAETAPVETVEETTTVVEETVAPATGDSTAIQQNAQ